MKPATALPWKSDSVFGDEGGSYSAIRNDKWEFALDDRCYIQEEDLAYIVHACNAYPKLVEALHHFEHDPVDDTAEKLLRELGEIE